jgi:D-alanyl-D-alanine carboxypeptidase (penicillin-binding protein 5/6)
LTPPQPLAIFFNNKLGHRRVNIDMPPFIFSGRGSQNKGMPFRICLMCLALILILALTASAATKKHSARAVKKHHARPKVVLSAISRDPYLGAIVVDAATGRVIYEDNADGVGYPASVVKLIDMLIILERVQQGTIKLTDTVTVTAESVNVGGSQANLRRKEAFSIDDLLYALMLKSANDAATALAIHVAGSKVAFIELMNRKAKQLGMTSTHFNSVNGLPPPLGSRPPDEATARDLSLLARAVLKYPDTLRYTSTKFYAFRKGEFDMNNHNHLLGVVEGCDGLKTGYFRKAGFSIVATAQQNNVRLIAVVLGSRDRHTRDSQARTLLAESFRSLPQPTASALTNTIGSQN